MFCTKVQIQTEYLYRTKHQHSKYDQTESLKNQAFPIIMYKKSEKINKELYKKSAIFCAKVQKGMDKSSKL